MNAFRSPFAPASIEPLELRIAPAVLSLSGSMLTYTAGSGIANNVTVVFDLFGNNYVIQDSAETILLNPAAEAAGFTVSANGHNAVGPAPALTSLTLELGDQDDNASILASAMPINIHGGNGEDHFNIGANSLLFVQGDVTIDGGGGARNFLAINDAQTRLAGTYTATGSAISRSSGPTIDFSGVSDISLHGGLGANTFRIEALNGGQSFEVQGSDGFDTFIVGSAGNSLGSIGGELDIITNGGNDRLFFNDQNRAGNSPATLTNTTFDAGGGPHINYQAQAGDTVVLNLRPSPTATLFVSSLASGVEYVLNAGLNGNPIILGGGGPDALGGLLGHVTINGNDASTLTVDDSAGSTPHNYVIDASTLSRDGVEFVRFNDLLRGVLSTGSGDDFIKAKASTTRFDFNTGGGDDRIVAPVLSASLNTGPGTDTLTVTRIPGDVMIEESGLRGSAFGLGLTFPGGAPEFIKIVGDKGPNTINAESFGGFAILDGGGGDDTLIGGQVHLLGKSATFTDPDGDLVTIQNDVARFGVGNFDFIPTGGRGGVLSRLDLSAGTKSFAEANLTITATRSDFGDGRTAVGQIVAAGVDLASIVIDGDLAALDVGDADASTRALGLLQVNSLGHFGATYLPSDASADFFFTGKAVRVEVATDFASGILNVSGGANNSGKLGALVVGGDFAGNVYTTGRIGSLEFGNMTDGSSIIADSGARIAALLIRHEMRNAEVYADGPIGNVEIGGNMVSSRILARGNVAPATDDAALAIASLHIGGSLTDSFIGAGFSRTAEAVNPDVTIGLVMIAGNFNRSDLFAGVDPNDDLIATAAAGPFAGIEGGDPNITSRIAKVVIGGAAFGALTQPAPIHSIIAQQIGRMKIGGELLPFGEGVDEFPLSLLGDILATEIG